MKVCVINGSPKGKYSITLQTVHYLEKRFSDCEFSVLHVGQRIKALKKEFDGAAEVLPPYHLLTLPETPKRGTIPCS